MAIYDDLTPGERLSAIAEILATAIIRYNMRRGQKDGEQNAKVKFKTEKVRGGVEKIVPIGKEEGYPLI